MHGIVKQNSLENEDSKEEKKKKEKRHVDEITRGHVPQSPLPLPPPHTHTISFRSVLFSPLLT